MGEDRSGIHRRPGENAKPEMAKHQWPPTTLIGKDFGGRELEPPSGGYDAMEAVALPANWTLDSAQSIF